MQEYSLEYLLLGELLQGYPWRELHTYSVPVGGGKIMIKGGEIMEIIKHFKVFKFFFSFLCQKSFSGEGLPNTNKR